MILLAELVFGLGFMGPPVLIPDPINCGPSTSVRNFARPGPTFLVFGLVALMFFALCWPLSLWARHLEGKFHGSGAH